MSEGSDASRWLPAGLQPPAGEGEDAAPGAAWTPETARPATSPAAAPAYRSPGPDDGGLRRRIDVPLAAVAAAAVLLVAAVVAIVVLAASSGDADGTAARVTLPPAATATTATTTTTPTTAPADDALVRALRDPFVADGVRWAVFAAPRQPWTRFAEKASPGKGNRWLLLSVRVRNLSRSGFDPLALSYRLLDDEGHRYRPDPKRGTGPAAAKGVKPVKRDALTQAELAFRVPDDATQLRLSYPTGTGGGASTIVVPLGAS